MCNKKDFIDKLLCNIKEANNRNINLFNTNRRVRENLINEEIEICLQEILDYTNTLTFKNKHTLYIGIHLLSTKRKAFLLKSNSQKLTMYFSLSDDNLWAIYYPFTIKSSETLDLSDFFISFTNFLSSVMKEIKEDDKKSNILQAFFKGIFFNNQKYLISTFYEINL